MTTTNLNRRNFMAGTATAALLANVAGPVFAASEKTVGIVYVGSKDDFGWSQAHAVSAAKLKDIEGITLIEEENVPETADVSRSMESMIQLDGAELIFGASFGYFDPFMIDLAKKYPDVQFRHSTTLWNKDEHPENLGGYFGYIEQGHYVNGVAAGLSTTTNKLGYVAAKPLALVLRTVNAFTMGVRSVNPDATVQLIITGEWSQPIREAEATNALIDAGCDVIACHVDSPKVVIETAEARGVKSVGHNADQSALAPNGFITGAELNWARVYVDYAEKLKAGEPIPNLLEGGYDNEMVTSTPFGAGATEAAVIAAEEAIAGLKEGKPIFVGPLRDNQGNTISETTLGLYDGALWGTDYLVEGVIGSLS